MGDQAPHRNVIVGSMPSFVMGNMGKNAKAVNRHVKGA